MIYFSDDFNFKEKNFPELYNFLKKYSIKYDFDKNNAAIKKPTSFSYKSIIIDEHTICEEKYFDINLYNTYIHELLYICSSSPQWIDYDIPLNDQELASFFYTYFTKELLSCREKTIFFIDYWKRTLAEKKIDLGISFGGNLIYANTYAKVLASNNIPHFCVEHFFTGNDFYFERRYEPLPNNSLLQNTVYCTSIASSLTNKAKKMVKIRAEKNKNVKQPAYYSLAQNDYILILAQVRNDFSIASKHNLHKNTIKFYIEIISKILSKTNYNIVVKTHPYEMKKINDISMTTYSILEREISRMNGWKNRITLVDDFSLYGLIDNAKMIVTLNSQSGLQALERFKPVACFGGAFYGQKGFTFDYSNTEEFINNIDNIKMDLAKYEKYLKFMDATFEHLIGTGEENKIGKILAPILNIVDSPQHTNLPTFNKQKSPTPPSKPNALSQNTKLQDLDKKKISTWVLPEFNYKKMRKLFHSPLQFVKDSRIVKQFLYHFTKN